MLVCISSMQYKSHRCNTRCTGRTGGGIWSSHEEKDTPCYTLQSAVVVWKQLLPTILGFVERSSNGRQRKETNCKIKARHQWYGHQYTGLAFRTPWSHWLTEHLVISLHLHGFQHPNQSIQGKSFLGKHYELHPLSGINVEAMAL